jgi:hypothetical protein
MILPPWWVTAIFGLIGLGASVFYAWYAYDIFLVSTAGKPQAWDIHQRWFNFVGSALGWMGLWFVARKVYHCLAVACPGHLDWSDAALIAVAFVGITGHLPYALSGLLEGLRVLALKLTGASVEGGRGDNVG